MIPKRPKIYQTNFKGSSWRNYQRKLKKTAAINKFIKNIPKYSVVFLFVLIFVCGIISGFGGSGYSGIELNTSNSSVITGNKIISIFITAFSFSIFHWAVYG